MMILDYVPMGAGDYFISVGSVGFTFQIKWLFLYVNDKQGNRIVNMELFNNTIYVLEDEKFLRLPPFIMGV